MAGVEFVIASQENGGTENISRLRCLDFGGQYRERGLAMLFQLKLVINVIT